MKLLLLAILALSCRSEANPPKGDRLGELLAKVQKYIEYSKAERDENGWILPGDCDGLFHNALASLGGSVDYGALKLAEETPGRWYRTPKKDCLSSGRSKSSISRDQLLGVYLAAVEAKDRASLVNIQDYAQENNYIMGDHDGSIDGRWRVVMTPAMYSLLRISIEYLSGPSLVSEELERNVDFTDHLKALEFFLVSRIKGGASVSDLTYMRYLTEQDPNNALYWALRAKYDPDMRGMQDRAISILLREDLFPEDRLPTSKDRCVPYLWMHGENDGDWTPCPDEKKTHPGHDLLFAAYVIYQQTIKGD